MDLLVNLYDMGKRVPVAEDDLTVRRALAPDRARVLDFVRTFFPGPWESECAYALSRQPISCYIAVREHKIVGFSCYDATARGYFGPTGVDPAERGRGAGQRLLYAALDGMREAGYGYGVIGWMDSALGFYQGCLKAHPIPDSQAANTIYQRMAQF